MHRNLLAPVKRIGAVVAATVAVAASLLTFPGGLPWMIAAWLAFYSLLALRGKPGWIPLATCAAIVLVKRVDGPISLLVLGAIVLASCFVRALPQLRRYVDSRRPIKIVVVAALWIAWAGFVIEWRAAALSSRPLALDKSRTVVCLGDSLTAAGYPQELQKMISATVVSLAREGATTDEALKQLPALVAAEPQAVIIEIGGNDYVKGRSRLATRKNLQKIIDVCRAIDATVVLVEIPRGFISDPYGGLERELARQNDLQLLSDTPIRQLVLWSPYAPPGIWCDSSWHLSDDGLHPNTRGNQHLARSAAAIFQ